MSQKGDTLEGLSPNRRALVERMLKSRRPGRPDFVPRRSSSGPSALSCAQQLLWLSAQMIPEPSTYNVPIILRITGALDTDALRKTLDAILARHEVLRSRIELMDGNPVQVAGPAVPVPMRILDLTALPEAAREEEVRRLVLEEARHGFDLSCGPLLRALVLQTGALGWHVVLVTHHVAFDGWSKRVFFRELAALYSAIREGKPYPLAELPVQYADYAAWERARAESPEVLRQLAYWKKQLDGAPPVLELPADRPRPPVQSFRGGRLSTSALRPFIEPLKAIRAGEGTTLFMQALSVFCVLLYRYTGQTDLVIGTPILGRPLPELQDLIGVFINTLVLRIDTSGNPTFRELLSRVRKVVLDAFDNQDTPIERLTMELVPERDPSYTPLFQVLFSAGESPMTPPALPGLEVKIEKLDRGITKLDLMFGVTAVEGQMMDGCEYSSDLFDRDTVERMVLTMRTLLEAIVEDPGRRIDDLPLLSKEEERRVTIDWNRTEARIPGRATLHRLVEAQVTRIPGATAAEYGDRSLTYRELNARANRLARRLQSLDVGPDVPVGIFCGPSLAFAVAVLAVLKAGGACVPLDPAYPAERRAFMMQDSGIRVLLAQDVSAAGTPPGGVRLLDLGREWDLEESGCTDLNVPIGPESLAYIIYTSGTTLEPRGVTLTHQGLVNHSLAAIPLYGFTPAGRMAQFASVSFDISLEEMFPVWMSGGTVVFRPQDLLITGAEFLEWIARRRITALDLPTAFWHSWVEELERLGARPPECLRLVIVGGERAQAPAYAAWRRIAGNRVRWINTYGPTETSVIVTAFEPPADEDAPATLPIGKPIANMRVYVLDRNLRPVPIGVPGELHVGGAGVARGYRNRPDLTAAKFIPDPFSNEPGARLYKTGDLVKYRADGNLEFIGRIDRQAKIHGFRVEPTGIEAVLRAHDAVRDAYVMVRQDSPGDRTLAAYVTAKPGVEMATRDLRDFLRSRLPHYMLPAHLVVLDELPSLPNGKVDWRALPACDRLSEEAETVAPRTPIEEILVHIWSEVLRRDGIGIHDNFFYLGGHSLLATQVISRVCAEFGIRLSLRTMLEAPTVAELSEIVFNALSEQAASAASPL